MQEENFMIAAFRSRQQVMTYERALRQQGVHADIITTPRAVALGCGLSVRFEEKDLDRARRIYQQLQPGNLVGFYRVERAMNGKTTVRPVHSRSRSPQ